MKFGLLKTKIEKILTESYEKNSVKDNMFIFNELILKNKNISKIYYLYDELSSKKGLNESLANEYINQSIIVYENLINKLTSSQIKEIQMWVGHIQCENEYTNIDNLFSSDVTKLETKIESKKTIVETLKSKPTKEKENTIVPMNEMVKIANDTVSKYLENLTESEKTELKGLLKEDDKILKENYFILKGKILNKLEIIDSNETDKDTSIKINETIEKIQKTPYNINELMRLKKLYESL
jgi:hypothetical protein